MKAFWPLHEKKLLREHYAEPDGPQFIAEETGKTYQQIASEANRMGLHRQKRHYASKGMKKYFQPAEPLPKELKSGKCPGKFAYCGRKLWSEPVHDERGFSTPHFDLICEVGHRFPIPENGKRK